MIYKELVKLDMPRAREELVKNLIAQRQKIEHRIVELEAQLQSYTEDYNHAKRDGDARENSALDTATSNMQMTSSEIYSNNELLKNMDRITEPEYLLHKCTVDFDNIVETLSIQSSESMIAAAILQRVGDNPAGKLKAMTRKEADELMKYVHIFMDLPQFECKSVDRDVVHMLQDALLESKPRPYVTCGKVVIYSAVRIEINGVEYVIMICPEDITFMWDGIVAANSEIARHILGRSVTNTYVHLNDKIKYIIKEIY